jgi:hypothetical protein
VPYSIENALFQWRGGEQRLREAEDPERRRLERAVDAVVEELRRRLGSSFAVSELAGLYAEDTDWATELVQRQAPGAPASDVVDAAFARYSREARVRPDL